MTSITAGQRVAGRVLTALSVLFLSFDTVIKLAGERHAVEGTTALGFAPHLVGVIGAIEAVCLLLYVVPRTAPFGAVLLTGFLGGAVAIHTQLGNPLPTHTLFPVYTAATCWVGLYLRDARVRALLA